MTTTKDHREAGATATNDRRARVLAALGTGVLASAVVVAVIGAAFWTANRSDRSSDRPGNLPAPLTSSPASGAQEEEIGGTAYLWHPNTGDARSFTSELELYDADLSLDGDRLVYEGHGSDVLPQIYLIETDGTERRLTDLSGGAYDPTWSPDGNRIAFAAERGLGSDADIFTMDAGGGRITRVAATPKNDGHPDWSPDGSHIAFHSMDVGDDLRGQISVASVHTGSLTRLTRPHTTGSELSSVDPSWSPDGRWIAYSRFIPGLTLNGELVEADVWRMRSDGTHGKPIVKGRYDHVLQSPDWSSDGRSLLIEDGNWRGGKHDVLFVDPRTGRTRVIIAGVSNPEPSWGGAGILMSSGSGTSSWDRDQIPTEEAPRRFQINIPTITMTGRSCELDKDRSPIQPRLELELVNDSRLEGHFTIVRLTETRTFSELRTSPPSFYFGRPSVVSGMLPSITRVWSGTTGVDAGLWAVLCYKDTIPGPHGITIVNVGVAGPIKIG